MRSFLRKLFFYLEEKFNLQLCVIFSREFDYTKNKSGANNGFKDACPFCTNPEDIVEKYHNILLIKNKYPYFKAKDHLLIIPKRHIRTWNELNLEELQEIQRIISKYLDQGYLLLGRQFVSKTCENFASVHHLHIHFLHGKRC